MASIAAAFHTSRGMAALKPASSRNQSRRSCAKPSMLLPANSDSVNSMSSRIPIDGFDSYMSSTSSANVASRLGSFGIAQLPHVVRAGVSLRAALRARGNTVPGAFSLGGVPV